MKGGGRGEGGKGGERKEGKEGRGRGEWGDQVKDG